MFKNLKLLVTMVGLVAVLVMGLVVPGATQQIELPTRAQIVKGLSQLVAMLTASEGDILDVENVTFASLPFFKYTDDRTLPQVSYMTYACIPLHYSIHPALCKFYTIGSQKMNLLVITLTLGPFM